MFKKMKIFIIVIILFNSFSFVMSEEDFFNEAKKMYDQKKFDEAKFLLQRNIVFNPKDAISYLYLAKIFNFEENQKEEKKNLDTTLLLQPNNEEAMYMLMEIELKKSNYSSVKKLQESFGIICKDLCEKNKIINKSLKNIEPKNDS
jgi:tetratricopeptide (TPR) repeat protein|tara:strand:+ start:2412 stop:2849 length:438 start_codon:yes stop_codon:yes gene_type:complete